MWARGIKVEDIPGLLVTSQLISYHKSVYVESPVPVTIGQFFVLSFFLLSKHFPNVIHTKSIWRNRHSIFREIVLVVLCASLWKRLFYLHFSVLSFRQLVFVWEKSLSNHQKPRWFVTTRTYVHVFKLFDVVQVPGKQDSFIKLIINNVNTFQGLVISCTRVLRRNVWLKLVDRHGGAWPTPLLLETSEIVFTNNF